MWKIAFLLYYISNETTSLAASWGLLATCYDPGADLTEQKQVVTHGHLANKLEGEPSQISDGKKVKAHILILVNLQKNESINWREKQTANCHIQIFTGEH